MISRFFRRRALAAEGRLQEAATWLLRLRQDEDTEDADRHAAWLRWSRKDGGNLHDFEGMLDLVAGLRGLGPEQKSTLFQAAWNGPGEPARRRGRGGPGWIPLALAAGVVLAAVAAGTLVWSGHGPGGAQGIHATGTSQIKTVLLADGSSLTLGAQSRVEVAYSPHVRWVRLIAGEAYFKVKHDAQRPFVVDTRSVRVEDVGTAFDVNVLGDRVTVAVATGVVDAAYKLPQHSLHKGSTALPLRLTAGQELIADEANERPTVGAVDPGNVASWRHGRLLFENAPLSDVVAAINRYSKHRIVLGDPRTREMHFTGTVFLSNIDEWLAATRQVFPVREARLPDGRIVLSAAPPQQQH